MRDPRQDPQAGDVVIYGPQWQQERAEVYEREGNVVRYRMGRASFVEGLRQWREIMFTGAEVLHVATPPAEAAKGRGEGKR